ncbi:hypothetical protein [Acinetobacter gerneri]|uniref:Uncharacterized protein n=2 Tax=Acinetobacter gerneri TaxID=202952 RepID=N8YCL9_9GAMM|nr:hypothetical protein [Acinetobacter gerneri]ENV34507.1 hypothetical protein F960_01245 [Acinetobacter gerneri DSM 14967 = CIP 107464 = MTCC 9824]EPR82939.1 hypothetical protein L289_2664 [Acinetobacter gerneri DSM 14967 = CIP 107464 = MTCC 9824]MDQ9008993.1 hypothetical protein [Acinetobacter gerneri]MDQ9013097.1 hypothetical protein [Acinetobacter gerneri]MDQ9024534.1 hypothetical protein [Acinetobacter gerneri]
MGVLKIESDSLKHLTSLIEKLVSQKDERRIGRAEFAHLLNIEPETLDRKIRDGLITRPFKDGRKSYWFSSYVQTIVKDTTNSANIATE